MKIDKSLSASGPHQGLCPWTLLGYPTQKPCYGLTLCARRGAPFGNRSWIHHCPWLGVCNSKLCSFSNIITIFRGHCLGGCLAQW